jgi:hypothetical protein
MGVHAVPKYAGLGEFLSSQAVAEVPMTFTEIERVTGSKLPPSAHKHRPWWSNNPKNSVMTKVWLDAGFETERVDMAGQKLVFRRRRQKAAAPTDAPVVPASSERTHHPAFGAMKELMRIMPGADLTEPADPSWGELLDEAN